VVESKASRTANFASAIRTRLKGASSERMIVGAVFEGGQPRIVRVDDFMLEAIPEGPTLFILNHDQPGVVGTVGTLLGEAGVNISRMQLALKGGQAAMLVNIDSSPPEAVLESLRKLENVISADLLELGA
jgi:D-3-phosphoglycerate dehydrogenase